MSSLFLHCRAGFESECATEIQTLAAAQGVGGYCIAKPGAAYVIFQPPEPEAAARLHRELPFTALFFIRQWFVVTALCNDLPPMDRITPIVSQARALPAPVADVFLETPDTNEGKELSGLCRAIERPLRVAVRKAGIWPEIQVRDTVRLHVCFMSGSAVYVGYALPANSAPWSMGIPRLKFFRSAPSRSTLKLEEAFLHFLTERERETLLQPGMTAVDLGAAPGGWTWQLVRRHLRVTAVDNAALAPNLIESGLVQHVRADGFRFQPPRPVHWLVCDIIEQPIRVAELVARWFAQNWCIYAIFNLKLPMKKRYQELQRCLASIDVTLRAAVDYRVAGKQLYHDREEVTIYMRRRTE